ncbi:MAG TPA: phage virion morphogenesis protein [Gammaproteobacteria bacterium]|nr:phage virion morphogenesis protein [Gammaproteobacteria bacterium]
MAKKTEITVRPTLEELRRRHEAAMREMRGFQAPHRQIGVFLDQWVQQNFRTEGAILEDGPWPPFAGGGRVVLTSGGSFLDSSAKLLQDTGRLRASFAPFASARNAGIGSDVPYARAHHEGVGDLPERRLLPREDEVRQPIREIFDGHVEKALARYRSRGSGGTT